MVPLSLFGGKGNSSSRSSRSSSTSTSTASASSRPLSSPPQPPPPAEKPSPGALTLNSALVWLFYVAYFSFVFFSRELPGLPVLETPPEVLTEVLHESWTFYYFVPLFNMVADAAALVDNFGRAAPAGPAGAPCLGGAVQLCQRVVDDDAARDAFGGVAGAAAEW